MNYDSESKGTPLRSLTSAVDLVHLRYAIAAADHGSVATPLPPVDAAQAGQTQHALAAMVDNAREHQPHPVLMGGQENGGPRFRPRAAFGSRQAADAVDGRLFHQGPPPLFDHVGDGRRVAVWAGRLRQAF